MSFDLWTLGFQAVNVLVLVWLLHRFFWTPVAGMIADRQAKAATLLEEAEAKRAEAKVAMREIEATRKGLAAERDAVLAAARKDAESASDAVLEAAKAEAKTLHDTAKAARVRAAEALKETAIADAQGLALTIAGKLVARLDSTAAEAAFLGRLRQGITGLSDADRKALAISDLEVVSATEADAAAQDRIAGAIASALGTPVPLIFRTDPALIAGLELHNKHFAMRNSWRSDLALIAGALGDKDALPDAP